MSVPYFGTDGLRGRANRGKLSPLAITQLGLAIAQILKAEGDQRPVLIGRDTRRSGSMLVAALSAGVTSGGCDIVDLGILPTPGVGYLAREMEAALGLMVTASHNPAEDNGIKLFGPDGYKLSDTAQAAIEAALIQPPETGLAPPRQVGTLYCDATASARYVAHLRGSLAGDSPLSDVSVVFDGAHGAGAHLGGALLRSAGAKVKEIGTTPDGININAGVGSTAPDALCAAVRETGADIGVALDGDGDRLILVDEGGHLIDGDQMIGVLAARLLTTGQLKTRSIVATVMSNLGLERALVGQGLDLIRTAVGDRHVVAEMRARGANLGGEASGHIILGDQATTGDGMLTALHLLAHLAENGRPASEVFHFFTPAPQTLLNVRRGPGDPLKDPIFTAALAEAEAELAGTGRVLVRQSGTEPLIRIMVEATTAETCRTIAEHLAAIIIAASPSTPDTFA